MSPEHEIILADLQRVINEEWSDAVKNSFYLTGLGDNGTMSQYHNTLGRWIRNKYNLWEIPWEPELKNGIDYSPDHPDSVSDTLLKELWNRGLQLEENK